MVALHTVRHGVPGGEPLLLLHGVTGHGRRWDALASGPWSHRDVLAPDLRGHGLSTWEPPWSIETLVDDVVEVLDHHGIATVDVVGHSFGGSIAAHLLARFPDRVRRLVLLDPGFSRDPALMAAEAEAMVVSDGWASVADARAARRGGWLSLVEDAPSGGTIVVADRFSEALDHELDTHLVAGPDGRLRFRFSPAAVTTGLGELSRPVPAVPEPRPTLLVVAGREVIVTPAVLAELRDRFGALLRDEVLDSGHMVLWERPDEVASLVEGFLSTP
jgi:lipase